MKKNNMKKIRVNNLINNHNNLINNNKIFNNLINNKILFQKIYHKLIINNKIMILIMKMKRNN